MDQIGGAQSVVRGGVGGAQSVVREGSRLTTDRRPVGSIGSDLGRWLFLKLAVLGRFWFISDILDLSRVISKSGQPF